ncbi:unnamed protein product [Clonostachys chloroleuca]|uniref:Uncharacterized protein n=1 Tax=Clonostachys chloroleuca TaxID=1926264 RepID=A0AA35Q5D8_9HYPO|nr:unnamed protein product [Clonostachys chloroleuca]
MDQVIMTALPLVNLMAVSHLAGYHFASETVIMPNTLSAADTVTILKEFYRTLDVGRKYAPVMVAATIAGFLLQSWWNGRGTYTFVFNMMAGTSMGLLMPYTYFGLVPYNDKLLSEYKIMREAKKQDSTYHGNLQEVRGHPD